MTTPRLSLPYIAPSQAQKHVTHNEALRMLDAIVQVAAISRSVAAPPATPSQGDCYIVAAAATGAWDDHESEIAAFQDGAWAFHAPLAGWHVWVSDESVLCVFDGANWTPINTASPIERVERLGINAAPSSTNKLTLSSAASLFDHAGAGHQLKLNKAAVSDTGSLLYQTNYSGRAEIGLTGNDNLAMKVSDNGSTWRNAISIDRRSGGVSGRFFDSQQIVVTYDHVGTIQPPSSGGIVFFSLVDAGFPQNPVASIFAYDVGSSPLLTTMVLGTSTENRGTTSMTGTTSTAGKVGVAVDGSGNLYIENRFTGGQPRQFCLTFINSYRDLS